VLAILREQEADQIEERAAILQFGAYFYGRVLDLPQRDSECVLMTRMRRSCLRHLA
jgi:hypothetical protein